MQPYPKYKDAGVPWLGKIPEHWECIKMKYLFRERVQKGFATEPLLAATQKMGVVPKEIYKIRTVVAQKDLHLLKLVNVGDFVISLRSFQGGIEYAYYRGIISPAYTVITSGSWINAGYFRHLSKSKVFIALLKLCVTGIREGQNVDYQILRNTQLPVPPLPEQDQIVRFLDCKLAQIAKFIRAKKKLIATLKEQKQAIINNAVTKGLNPNAKMKPSGISWLGDVPEEWEIAKLKRYLINNSSKCVDFKNTTSDNKVVFLPMEKISTDGKIDNSEKRNLAEVRTGFTYFEKNDVVVAKITPCFENGKGACLSELETPFGYGTTELIVLKANEKILPQYLYFITVSSYFRIFGSDVMTGSAGQKRVPAGFILNFIIGIPNLLSEQQAIVNYIINKRSEIDTVIAKAQQEIDLITEYRIRLISDVVTGKVDVRNIDVEPVENIEEIEEFDGVEENETVEEISEIEA